MYNCTIQLKSRQLLFLFEAKGKQQLNSKQTAPHTKLAQLLSSLLIARAFSSKECSSFETQEDIDEFEISTAVLKIQLVGCSSLLMAMHRSSLEDVDMEVLEVSMTVLADAVSSPWLDSQCFLFMPPHLSKKVQNIW